MKQISIILIFLFTVTNSAQIETGIRYYSDKYASKEVTNGSFKKELIRENDSTILELFSKTKSGQKIWSKRYLYNQPYGVWKWYDKKGNIRSTRNYNFKLKYGEYIPENAVEFETLGIDKMLDENTKKIQKHVRNNFRYPEIAQENGYQGSVELQFTIDKNGRIDNLRILKKGYLSLDTECFRIMSSLEKLEPYKKDGETIMTYYKFPITFRLQ